MAEKRGYNSKMNAKGLENFVSEDQARDMCTHQGKRYLMIVELHSGRKVVDEDGSETANLVPDLVELIPAEQEDRVRTFMRALYHARPDQFGQQAFEVMSESEPNVEQAGAALDAAVETDPSGEPTGMWTGDPDAPFTPDDSQACPFPECPLLEGHDGDHTQAPEVVTNVVSLTHGATTPA